MQTLIFYRHLSYADTYADTYLLQTLMQTLLQMLTFDRHLSSTDIFCRHLSSTDADLLQTLMQTLIFYTHFYRCLSSTDTYLLQTLIFYILLLLITFIYRCSPLSSRLTALACDSTWVNSFYSAFFWISTEVVYLQRWHGWCHKNLLPERVSLGEFCVHHTTMRRVTSCKATYVRCMRV